MEKVNQFFEFEIENHLFDIVDSHGLRPWESVRFDVMLKVLYESSPISTINERSSFLIRLLRFLHSLQKFIFYILCHQNKDNLFFLYSRDKKDSLFYDKVFDDLYLLVDKKNCFTIESWDTYSQKNYKYGRDVIPNYSHLFRRLCHVNFDFTEVCRLLKQEFPNAKITADVLNNCYKNFICEYRFYSFLFRFCHIKKVFFVQNGVQKGMMAAANELGVTCIELQHGQVSMNHPSYSYPGKDLLPATKIYHPDYFLTFGSYWSNNHNYPGVNYKVLGNNSYAESIPIPDVHGNKRLLVISNRLEGPLLADCVEEVLKKSPSFSFIFKLHPQQYNEYDIYKSRFKDFCQVEVVSNQQTINQLLMQCEGIFLCDSTVELEALRLGRKVFVLAEMDFESMDFIFGEDGVYLCKDVDEFLLVYERNKDVRLTPRSDLFELFDENVALEMIHL